MFPLFAVLVALLADRPAVSQDACASMLPNELSILFTRQHPELRLPRETDNAPETIAYHRAHGGNGCLGVTPGDFDGKGGTDLAFLATSMTDVWLFVAFRQDQGWRLEKVWCAGAAEYRPRLYVDVAPPGQYDDLGLADALAPGQVHSFTSQHEVVVTGATESTAIAFRKAPRGWIHVWLSD